MPIALLLLVYAFAWIRFTTGEVKVTRNPAAQLNAPILATPESDRAWPILRRAVLSSDPLSDELHKAWPPKPGDPMWDEAVLWLEHHQKQLDVIRSATSLPCFGAFYTAEEDAGLIARNPDSKPPGPAVDNPHVLKWSLTFLGTARHITRWLRGDAALAASRGHHALAMQDVLACLRLAKLLAGEVPVIQHLVAIAVASSAGQALGEALIIHPGLFTEQELAELDRTVVDCSPILLRVPLDFESSHIDDLAQRFFTDDGNGDGRINSDGYRAMTAMSGGTSSTDRVSAPFISLRFSRKSILAERDELFRVARETIATPRWKRLDSPTGDVNKLGELRPARDSLPFAQLMAPAIAKSISAHDQIAQFLDGVRLLIAAERYRLRHGEPPASTESIDSDLLAGMPTDLSDGKPLRLRIRDSWLVIYSIGGDCRDDGGVPCLGRSPFDAFTKRPPVSGDYILFPAVDTDDDGYITSPGPWPEDRRRPKN